MPYLIDLSAFAVAGRPAVEEHWSDLLAADALICHPLFAVEYLHDATNPVEYSAMRSDLDAAFEWSWPDQQTSELALEIQRHMAESQASAHRVKAPDILIAALAVQTGLGVAHYDSDYDQIGSYGGVSFESHWIAPRGSLDGPEQQTRSARKAYRRAFGERMAQLSDDRDIAAWPSMIEMLDRELHRRSLPIPPPPGLPYA